MLIKTEKCKYFTANLDANKKQPMQNLETYSLYVKLNSCQHKSANITEIKIGGQSISFSKDISLKLSTPISQVLTGH